MTGLGAVVSSALAASTFTETENVAFAASRTTTVALPEATPLTVRTVPLLPVVVAMPVLLLVTV